MKKRLLLEGPDDLHFVKNLLFNYDMHDDFEIKPKDGITKLLSGLGDELEATDLSCLGVIVDADTEMASRWARLQNELREAGYRTAL